MNTAKTSKFKMCLGRYGACRILSGWYWWVKERVTEGQQVRGVKDNEELWTNRRPREGKLQI